MYSLKTRQVDELAGRAEAALPGVPSAAAPEPPRGATLGFPGAGPPSPTPATAARGWTRRCRSRFCTESPPSHRHRDSDKPGGQRDVQPQQHCTAAPGPGAEHEHRGRDTGQGAPGCGDTGSAVRSPPGAAPSSPGGREGSGVTCAKRAGGACQHRCAQPCPSPGVTAHGTHGHSGPGCSRAGPLVLEPLVLLDRLAWSRNQGTEGTEEAAEFGTSRGERAPTQQWR